MKRITIAAALAIFTLGAAHATPWFTQDPRTLPEGKWRVEEHILYSETDSALVDGDRQALPGDADASALTLHTRVRYGATDDLTLFVDFPYQYREFSGGQERDSLGDLLLLGKYKYHDNRESGTRRAVALFLKPNDGDSGGDIGLLRTGTGTTNFGVTHLWEQEAGDTTWYASAGYIFTGDNERMNVDPGDIITANLAAEQDLGSGWRGVLELNGQYQARARRDGADLPDSESTVIAISPGVQYYTQPAPGQMAVFEAGVQIPTFKWGDRAALEDYTIYGGGYWVF
jgi:hypothetical protein